MQKVKNTYLLLYIFYKILPISSRAVIIGTDDVDFQYTYDEKTF